MKKQQALNKLKDLESEIEKLKNIINEPEDLFDKISNYKDVCRELNEKEYTECDFSHIENKTDRLQILAFTKIKQLQRLFNGNWVAKFDGKQQNWYPYFTNSSDGLGLVFYSSYDYHYSGSDGRVAFFKDKKTSDFIGKTFTNIHREIK
jgi:hypothetical protein